MPDMNASRAVGASVLRIAWSRSAPLQRVRRQVRATSAHPRLGEVVLVGITLMLVGLLLATVRHALQASPMPIVWGSNPHVIQVAPAPMFARLQ